MLQHFIDFQFLTSLAFQKMQHEQRENCPTKSFQKSWEINVSRNYFKLYHTKRRTSISKYTAINKFRTGHYKLNKRITINSTVNSDNAMELKKTSRILKDHFTRNSQTYIQTYKAGLYLSVCRGVNFGADC